MLNLVFVDRVWPLRGRAGARVEFNSGHGRVVTEIILYLGAKEYRDETMYREHARGSTKATRQCQR